MLAPFHFQKDLHLTSTINFLIFQKMMLKSGATSLVKRLCVVGTPHLQTSSRNTVIVKRVYQPPLVTAVNRDAFETSQRVIDKSVVNTEDDKYMVYEVEEMWQKQEMVKVSMYCIRIPTIYILSTSIRYS